MKVKQRPATAESADSEAIVSAIIESIAAKKGESIISLDLRNLEEAVTDFFVVCHATSTTQVKAIADQIIRSLKDTGYIKPWHSEGWENLEWVLIDYVNVVAHVFLKGRRDYYGLEELWSDGILQEHDD